MFSCKSEAILFALSFLFSYSALDVSYRGDKTIVGKNTYVVAPSVIDNIDELPEQYGIGHDQFMAANPQLISGKSLQAGEIFFILERSILPKAIPDNTIVINVADKKLYYYHTASSTLYVFPVGIGRAHTPTPLGHMRIIHKRYKPTWNVTKEGLEEARNMGYVDHPKTIPPGPNNPLGDYAIHLSKPNYLIHSTNEPTKIGTQNTAGCINLYKAHIEILYRLAPLQTPVEIIYMPIKTLNTSNTLWVEAHTPPINSTESWQSVIERELTLSKPFSSQYGDALAAHTDGVPFTIERPQGANGHAPHIGLTQHY